MVTIKEAHHASTHEIWTEYWKQCRINVVYHKFPDYSAKDNPIYIRFREIPEGEDISVPHPDIEVQMIEIHKDTNCFRALVEVVPTLTAEQIEKNTVDFHDADAKQNAEWLEFLEYKAQGNLKIETVDDTKPISWESIRNASTEELFQTKLEIFESPPVQESENKEYRANIRKSASIIEAMYWYYLIVNNVQEGGEQASTEGKLPENVSILLEDVPSELIFKWKLQIFELESVQNSENKKARSKIRKSTNLTELLMAYDEIGGKVNDYNYEEETKEEETKEEDKKE
jgi:hypothetical protein